MIFLQRLAKVVVFALLLPPEAVLLMPLWFLVGVPLGYLIGGGELVDRMVLGDLFPPEWIYDFFEADWFGAERRERDRRRSREAWL